MLVAVAIGEVAVRLSGIAPRPIPIRLDKQESVYRRSENPILGYELKENYRDPWADLHESLPETNSDGQRDVERRVDRRHGVRRILMLGDSVVAGHGILDLNDTLPSQLERRFPPETVEVLNFGVGGYCTRAEVELLRTKGLKYQPDLVLLVFLGNDYVDFNAQVHMYATACRRPWLADQAFLHSHLFRLCAVHANLFDLGVDTYPERWNQAAIGPSNVETGLALLRRLADENDFRSLVVLWPGFADDFLVDVWHEPHVADPLAVEQWADAVGIPVVRIVDFFREDAARATGTVNYRLRYTIGDTLHPSPKGNEVAARALEQILRTRYPDLFGNISMPDG